MKLLIGITCTMLLCIGAFTLIEGRAPNFATVPLVICMWTNGPSNRCMPEAQRWMENCVQSVVDVPSCVDRLARLDHTISTIKRGGQ